MLKPRSRILLGVAACLLIGAPLALFALGRPAHSAAADTVVVQVPQEPDSLDPYTSPLSASMELAALFYSGLVTLDDHGQWQADLAERVPTPANGDVKLTAGGMRVTYHLRRGLKWQDGQPLTSADVAATWKLLMDRRFPSISTAGYDRVTNVETPDARTAVVVYRSAYAPYLELFPFILPAHVVGHGEHPAQEAWNHQPVGSGPYRVERWISGDRLLLAANPAYFRGRPGIEHLEVRFVSDANTAFNMWRTGDLDLITSAPPTQYEDFQREAPGRLYSIPTTTWEHVLFNLERPIVKDLRVRQAIAHLIDRQAIASTAYGGVLQPAWSEVPTFSWAYNHQVEHRYDFDPRQAASLLDAAGWKPGPDGIRVKDGQRLTLGLLTTNDKPSRSLAAQIWRRQWREAGIELTIEKQPASAVFASAASGGRLAKGSFDLALVASISRPDPDTSFRWRSDQLPPDGQNRARYRDTEVDRLLDAGQSTVDQAARVPIYAKLALKLSDDLPVIPLLYGVDIDATSQRLQGFRPNPTLRGDFWNAWEWKLKQP